MTGSRIGSRSGGAVESAGSEVGSIDGDGTALGRGGATALGNGTSTSPLRVGEEVRTGSAAAIRAIVSGDWKTEPSDGIRGAGSPSQR
jgi:hypothetical protein